MEISKTNAKMCSFSPIKTALYTTYRMSMFYHRFFSIILQCSLSLYKKPLSHKHHINIRYINNKKQKPINIHKTLFPVTHTFIGAHLHKQSKVKITKVLYTQYHSKRMKKNTQVDLGKQNRSDTWKLKQFPVFWSLIILL